MRYCCQARAGWRNPGYGFALAGNVGNLPGVPQPWISNTPRGCILTSPAISLSSPGRCGGGYTPNVRDGRHCDLNLDTLRQARMTRHGPEPARAAAFDLIRCSGARRDAPTTDRVTKTGLPTPVQSGYRQARAGGAIVDSTKLERTSADAGNVSSRFMLNSPKASMSRATTWISRSISPAMA